MPGKWYLTRDGVNRYGPYDEDQLKEYAGSGRILRTDKLWQEGTDQWVSPSSVISLLASPPPPPGPPPVAQPASAWNGTKIAAGICGILLGSLGIHKFVAGLTTPGLIMLLVTLLTCGIAGGIMHIIGLIEGIIYLTKSDEEFHQTYIVGKKGWF
jgi:TM2 domain-containing membrane protein YozV